MLRILAERQPRDQSESQTVVCRAVGGQRVEFDQQKKPPIDGLWISLGTFEFAKGKGGSRDQSPTTARNGFVIIDAVQWVPVK